MFKMLSRYLKLKYKNYVLETLVSLLLHLIFNSTEETSAFSNYRSFIKHELQTMTFSAHRNTEYTTGTCLYVLP